MRPLGGLTEVASTAAAVIRYPLGLTERSLTTGSRSDGGVHDTPVLLVHGYGHNQSGWWEFDRQLRQAGFTSVHRLNYLPFGTGVPSLARQLADRVAGIRALTGCERVNVIAHSMGGVLLRWYVQELEGDTTIGTAITLASPHEGTLAAFLWPERTARQLRPGSWLIDQLAAGARPSPVRWIAYWSDSDLLVRPHSAARIAAPDLQATNIRLRGVGHMTYLVSGAVVARVIRALEASGTQELASTA